MEVSWTKYKNSDWTVTDRGEGRVSAEDAHLCVLMDIRKELQLIRQRMWVFDLIEGMPKILKDIRARVGRLPIIKASKNA